MHINHYHRIKSLRPEHAPRRNAEETAAATPQESMRVLVVDRVLLLGRAISEHLEIISGHLGA